MILPSVLKNYGHFFKLVSSLSNKEKLHFAYGQNEAENKLKILFSEDVAEFSLFGFKSFFCFVCRGQHSRTFMGS